MAQHRRQNAFRLRFLAAGLALLVACSAKPQNFPATEVDAALADQDVVVVTDGKSEDMHDSVALIDVLDGQSLVDTVGCPGSSGCPCAQNSECDSALCLDDASVPGGKTCARNCVDSCPAGYTCAQVTSASSDLISVCVNATGRLCEPCLKSDDCKSPGLNGTACVVEGAVGLFCGIACGSATACPDGYTCAPAKTAEGTMTTQCVRKPDKVGDTFGTCPCDAVATAKKIGTTCFAQVTDGSGAIVGKCAGTRQCGDKGLGACTALPPTAEVCDGIDNNCDGQTDEGTCNDAQQCTTDTCDAKNGCAHLALDGTPCDADGSVCTVGDICKVGACAPGPLKNCDDTNPCTVDTCDPAKGCTQTDDDGAPCDADASACTQGDACEGGKCQKGQPVSCDDGNACTTDSCESLSGKCSSVSVTDGIPCNDGTKCTSKDLCGSGVCKGTPVDCDDGNPCTDDTCDAPTGCAPTPLTGAPCSDDNPCTLGDTCDSGQCGSGAPKKCTSAGACYLSACDPIGGQCVTSKAADGLSCDDGNACTLDDACASGTCTGTSKSCDDANPCTDDACDSKLGCSHTANTAPCDADQNPCTVGDACVNKACVPGASKVCDDGNFCTADVCNSATGACLYDPTAQNGGPCDADGSVCTIGDACQAGTCQSGAKADCDDKNGCTTDSCDALTGCTHVANTAPCNADDNACTQDDSCFGKVCVAGPVKLCDDGVVCTADSCDVKSGLCVYNAPAQDGATCNADSSICTVGDSCSAGTCLAGAKSDCDDKNGCTSDSCDAVTGCVHTANTAPCNADDNACTVGDNCVAKVCVAGATKVCDDGQICTADKCDVATGACTYNGSSLGGTACDADGSVCTLNDACSGGNCVPGPAAVCVDGKVCTTDACDATTGCTFTANANVCTDGNACTVGDNCANGGCVPGVKTGCDDQNACTLDTCVPATGMCAYVAQPGASCSDGNACSQGDVCNAIGGCVGSLVTCDDGNVCTSDTCNTASGCVFAPNTLPCVDGNACTINDVCAAAACSGLPVTPAAYCDDNNGCTADTCDPVGGCQHKSATGACSDDNPCTVGDLCSSGKCASGTNTCSCTTTADCAGQEDGNACNGTLFCDTSSVPYGCKVNPATVVTCSTASDNFCRKNTCNPTSGACSLVAQNSGQLCYADGTVCTAGDACVGGVCNAGGPLNCDDGNPCTDDSCDPIAGCKHAANVSPCSDNNPCTLNDKCAGNTCVAGAAMACSDGNACTTDACSGGACAFTNNSAGCDDGNLCTSGDKCAGGTCGGAPVTCMASDQCHGSGSCDLASGQCSNPNKVDGVLCDDANACTTSDVCTSGLCGGAAVVCAASDQCHNVGTCTAGTCSNPKKIDGAACTDGNACTQSDTCVAGACSGASPIVCTALDQCHLAGTCDSASGSCSNPAKANGSACSDGNACTAPDTCQGGGCSSGSAVVCAAIDQCHGVGACNSGTGVCTNPVKNDGTTCADGNACTLVDTCIAGACTGSNSVTCGALDQCHAAGTCDTSSGLCSNPAISNGTTCSDGNACTTSDKCTTGVCGGTAIVCTALDQCHAAGVCSAAACSNPTKSDGSACNDGNACTTSDICASGSCAGTATNCDDSNVCTADSCNATGTCVHTTTTSCDDGNTCTTDSCNAIGCQHANNAVNCNDGNTCTTGDACAAGTCKGTVPVCGNAACDGCETALTCATDCATPGMVVLPAGTFTMGLPASKATEFDQEPDHQVTLSAFELDKAEVTVAQYTTFYNQLGSGQKCSGYNQASFLCGNPANSDYPAYPPTMTGCNFGSTGVGQHPINCVDWFQADAYCAWAHTGGRLPTEAEWEYSARSGGLSQDYPWGSATPSCTYAVWYEIGFGCNTGSEWPVCSKTAGNSGQGACDLEGNVQEWCSDWYDKYPAAAQTNPGGPAVGGDKVYRGSSWYESGAANQMRATYRLNTTPVWRYPGLGFRCARTL